MNWRKYIIKPFYFKNMDLANYSLDKILKFASIHTKYYSEFGTDLNNYPILTKDIIRNNFEALKSDDLDKRKWFYNTSGGSTGEPVKFIQDMEFRNLQRIITYEEKGFSGYQFGDFIIKLWGNENEIFGKKNYKSIILDYLKNVKVLNTFNLDENKIRKYIKEMYKNPKLVVSYIQSIYQIAKYIKDNNLNAPKLNAIMTTAGTLYPAQKKLLQEVFNAKIYNRYGSREVGNIACNKEANNDELIVTKGVYLEVLENGKITNNGTGELLVTSLINYAMPLIRYNIGDIATLKTKNNIQTITKLHGRNVDMFKTRNGDFIDGEYFSDLFYFMEWVYKYQVIQKDYDYILVKIATKNPNKKDMQFIENGIKKIMGDCNVEFEIVNDIPQLGSGKFRYTISEV